MRKSQTLALCVMSCITSLAVAQTDVDRSFTVTAKNCDGIQWSAEALEAYPNIASACQAVEERNGKAYVKFEGSVARTANRGREVTVNFRDGGDLTLTPPAGATVYLDDRKTPVADLRRGDQLTFYVPEDRLGAHFYADNQSPVTTMEYVIIPIVLTDEPMASKSREQLAANLPATASSLPLLALSGLLMLAFAASLRIYRRR